MACVLSPFSVCLNFVLAHGAVLCAIYTLVARFWSVGDIISDAITTGAYYKYWQGKQIGSLESENTSTPNNTNQYDSRNYSIYNGEFWDEGTPGFFICAILIWILTPMWYAIAIYSTIYHGIFNFEKFEEISDEDKWKKFSLFFWSFIPLELKKTRSYNPVVKMCIFCVPPIGTLFFLTCFLFSTFMAYFYFPISAILTSVDSILNLSSNEKNNNNENSCCKLSCNYTLYVYLNKTRAFLTQQVLNENDINSLQFCEALCESLFQCFLSMFYYWKTTKGSTTNPKIELTTENVIIIISMIFSIVTIARVFGIMIFHVMQLKYGKGFYRRLRSSAAMDIGITLILITMLLSLIVVFLYIVA